MACRRQVHNISSVNPQEGAPVILVHCHNSLWLRVGESVTPASQSTALSPSTAALSPGTTALRSGATALSPAAASLVSQGQAAAATAGQHACC